MEADKGERTEAEGGKRLGAEMERDRQGGEKDGGAGVGLRGRWGREREEGERGGEGGRKTARG